MVLIWVEVEVVVEMMICMTKYYISIVIRCCGRGDMICYRKGGGIIDCIFERRR